VRVTRPARYLPGVLGVACATALGVATGISLADDVMLYLFAIMLAALGGRGPGIAAAALAVVAYDFFFIDPRYALSVDDLRNVMTFAVMFAVGTAMGSLVAALRRRERRTAALLAFTSQAASATTTAELDAALTAHVRELTGGRPRDELDRDLRSLIDAIERQAGVANARIRLAADARDAALRAQAEELRSSLLSTVSHDLRTPLAAITGMATALRESEGLTAEQVEALDTVVDEARRLGEILSNLLAITRVESGAALRREWVPVEELVGTALGRTETALAGHDVAIELERDVGVVVDPVLTELLLLNLLENAGKHTPAQTPVEIRARRDDGGVAIEVSDRGPGLPPGPEPQVFEKFFRGPDARVAGAGLGLAVCRGIALAQGGRIEAVRRDGGGATFRVWLPGGDPPAVEAEA